MIANKQIEIVEYVGEGVNYGKAFIVIGWVEETVELAITSWFEVKFDQERIWYKVDNLLCDCCFHKSFFEKYFRHHSYVARDK